MNSVKEEQDLTQTKAMTQGQTWILLSHEKGSVLEWSDCENPGSM